MRVYVVFFDLGENRGDAVLMAKYEALLMDLGMMHGRRLFRPPQRGFAGAYIVESKWNSSVGLRDQLVESLDGSVDRLVVAAVDEPVAIFGPEDAA